MACLRLKHWNVVRSEGWDALWKGSKIGGDTGGKTSRLLGWDYDTQFGEKSLFLGRGWGGKNGERRPPALARCRGGGAAQRRQRTAAERSRAAERRPNGRDQARKTKILQKMPTFGSDQIRASDTSGRGAKNNDVFWMPPGWPTARGLTSIPPWNWLKWGYFKNQHHLSHFTSVHTPKEPQQQQRTPTGSEGKRELLLLLLLLSPLSRSLLLGFSQCK